MPLHRLLFFVALVFPGAAAAVQGPVWPAPFVRYELAIYYADAPAREPRAALKARLSAGAGLPTQVAELPRLAATPVVQAVLEQDVAGNYAPPSAEMLQKFGRGLTAAQVKALRGARQALILRFAHPVGMAAYRTSLALVERLARDTGGLPWDEETREVFTPDAWHEHRLDGWQGPTPDVTRHIVIHAYPNRGLARAITLGMAKFGLPDLVVNDYGWSSNRAVGNLINGLAQQLAEGARPGAPGAFDLDLAALRHEGQRRQQAADLKAGALQKARLRLAETPREDGDPHNLLVEIGVAPRAGADRGALLEALLATVYGAEDKVQDIRHDDAIREASRRARARLPALQQAFARGFRPGEFLLVKAPFPTPGGGREWMWVEVTAWRGDAIAGLLQNQPRDIPTLRSGQAVQVSQAEVFDYLLRDPGGQEEGNETGKLIAAQAGGRR